MIVPLTPLRFLERAKSLYGSKQGVVCGAHRFTYGQFFERTLRLAGALRKLGLAPGDRVAFLSYNCHRLLEAYYAVPLAGGILLPLNYRLAAAETAWILRDSGARFLFLDADFLPLAESFRNEALPLERYFLLEPHAGAPAWTDARSYDQLIEAATPMPFDFMTVDENAIAELFYTSGTSGDPKGVMLSHRTLYLHALNVMIAQRYDDTSVQLHAIPLFHANGWGAAHSVTGGGGTHVMLRRFDPERVCQLIEQERVACFCLVPTLANALLHYSGLKRHNLSSLQWMHIGGAAATPELIGAVEDKLHCDCYGGYGLTETSPVLTVAHLKDSLRSARRPEQLRRKAMTGMPILGVELRVVDEQGNDVPKDASTMGEILVRGDGVMEGYWGQPEETRAVFSRGWLRTGDMAVWDEEGYVLIVDRKKEIIVRGGENISSLEIEKALCAHPAVYECAVIPVPDHKWGEVPKALVAPKEGATVTERELIHFLRQRIAKFKVPRSVEFVESLPKGGTGKILKKLLREKYWAGYAKRVH
jgi:fatty-acyl-CoA synthase